MRNFLVSYLFFLPLFFVQLHSFSDIDDCPGIVYDLGIDNATFSGKCSENGHRLWGITYYEGDYLGDDFRGLYYNDLDLRSYGSYVWKNDDYMKGHFLKSNKIKHELDYNFFGKSFIHDEGDQALGYYLDSEINGFAIYVFSELDELERTSEVGLFTTTNNMTSLSGYGKRVINSTDNWWGYWINGGGVGDLYLEKEDGSIVKHKRTKSGDTSGPFRMTLSDTDRLNRIQDFIKSNAQTMSAYWDEVQSNLDAYDGIIDENYSSDSGSDGSKKEERLYKNSELIRSIQELLIEVGYSPGRPDGILGQRTVAAIKAFQYAIDIEASGEPSDEILIALQIVIKSENKFSKTAKPTIKKILDPVLISTGTGFYVNTENIVTNNHVIEGCEYLTDSDGVRLKLLQADQANDLALLEGPSARDYLSISSSSPELGEKIYVAGYPYSSILKDFNFTSGNVSSLMGLGQDVANFKITAPVQPGNSGGAILNEYGSVIGVVVARLDDKFMEENYGSIPQNINFGIKNTILKILLSDNDIEIYEEKPDYIKSQKFVALTSKRASTLIQCYGRPVEDI